MENRDLIPLLESNLARQLHWIAGSMIYCGGISQRSAEQFREAISALSPETYIADLALQCHRNAEIATRKFTWIQRALFCLYLSVIPWVLALWLLYSATHS